MIWLATAFLVSAMAALGLYASCLLLECGPAKDWMPLLTPFLTMSVLIVGYYIWIDQTKLKRRFEVAEKAMLAMIAATDVLDTARSDFYTDADCRDRTKPAGENPEEGRVRDRWYVVLKRLFDRKEELIALRETELLCSLYLGADAASAVAEMSFIAIKVRTSAEMLMMTAPDYVGIKHLPPEEAKQLRPQVKQWEVDCSKHLWLQDEQFKRIPNSNRINIEIENARAKLKKACAPYLSTVDLK
jgi:hypothetical protein